MQKMHSTNLTEKSVWKTSKDWVPPYTCNSYNTPTTLYLENRADILSQEGVTCGDMQQWQCMLFPHDHWYKHHWYKHHWYKHWVLFTTQLLKIEQIYTLFCSTTLFNLHTWMCNVIGSSIMNDFTTFKDTENIPGQQNVFQGSRT